MALYDRIINYLNRKQIKGKDRLFSVFQKIGFRDKIVSNAKYGVKFNLNPNEYIDSVIIKEGFYESEITDEILKNLANGKTFWDIGANIGIHSIAVKKNVPGAKVYSFEPNPKTLNNLFDNIRLNGLDIKICSFALFDRISSMTLHIVLGNSGMSTLTPWDEADYRSSVVCLTTTGDDLCNNDFEIPNIIKIDTEGSEVNVLKGCKEILSSPELELILFETTNDFLDEGYRDEMSDLLKSYGFTKIIKLKRNENTHHALSNFAAYKK